MLSSLSYHIKNRILLCGAIVLALLSWNLALRNTYDAIMLNSKLNKKAEQTNDLSINPHYLNQKHEVLSRALKQYTLDSTEWKDDFWLKVSKAAALKEVSINYNPSATKPLGDSVSRIVKQEISFNADFRRLVSLLDSLEKMEGAGFISSTKFQKAKKLNMAETEKLYLKTSFGIVQKFAE